MGADVELAAANGALQAVNFAHKLEHKTGRRFTPDAFRRIGLFDVALAHYHYPISDFHRLFTVVGNKHAGEF